MYYIIYDGDCNLCVTLVQLLEKLDQGRRFQYVSMQDPATLNRYSVTPEDCNMGMILLNPDNPEQRWQGSDAAEAIGRMLPMGYLFVTAYRTLPGMKWVGDRAYEQIRDNRYTLFGARPATYESAYPVCGSDSCKRYLQNVSAIPKEDKS